MEVKEKYMVNAIIIGSSNVGKTSLMNRLIGKPFNDGTAPTLQVDFKIVEFKNEKRLPNSLIQIKYWDTLGQETYRSLWTNTVKKSDIIIFVRDKDSDNLEGEEGWIKFVQDNIKTDLPDKNIIFCLNKTDLLNEEEKMEIHSDLLNIAQSVQPNAEVHLISSKNSDGILTLKGKIQNFAINLILNEINNHKQEINVCLFGDSMVGKTSLIDRIINDDFMESTIATLRLIKKEYHFVDLKTHFQIKYNYYDIPGQEKIMNDYLDILKKIDIIFLVNDNNNLAIKFDILKQKININDKKFIFCINKKDLFSSQIKEIKTNYSKINKIRNEPIIVSAMNGEGIKELKKIINSIGVEIIEKKQKQETINEYPNSVKRKFDNTIIQDLEEVQQDNKKKSCWDEVKNFFKKH